MKRLTTTDLTKNEYKWNVETIVFITRRVF